MLYKVCLLCCHNLHNVGSKCKEMEVVVMAGNCSWYVGGSSEDYENQKIFESKVGKWNYFWIFVQSPSWQQGIHSLRKKEKGKFSCQIRI